ncbi:guanine deaminase [Mycena crocata]|nr:guanine deaminase [Mycena crocata]
MVLITPLLILVVTIQYGRPGVTSLPDVIASPNLSLSSVPFSTRAHWMRRVNTALSELASPCPFSAFSSVIVNHTAPGLGELVCVGVNNDQTGNPTLHGEIAAIQNCSAILTDPSGSFKLSPTDALDAFSQLSLIWLQYLKCASAIRWSGFREYIYGTSMETLVRNGWRQIRISSQEIFKQSFDLTDPARLIGEVLANETDPLLLWQFNPDFPCPTGCARSGSSCAPITAGLCEYVQYI